MDDLSLFTNTDFFDYDVFARDVLDMPTKLDNGENIEEFLKTISNVEPETIFNSGNNVTEPQVKQEFIQPSLLVSPVGVPEVKEVKKQRNTAASARFRIKKKQRQQEMELKIVKLNEDISNFNNHIKRLEIENKILKNLVFEKSETVKSEGVASSSAKTNIPKLLQKSNIDFQYTI